MIQITTETTHDHAQIHLKNDDIEIGSKCLKNLGTITLDFGDLTVFLTIEQAKTLHRTLNESIADAVKEGE
tara:strand:+ start:2379 stop:2591 length:213 start_codon:yes stop_codon:yes gene_type:complete